MVPSQGSRLGKAQAGERSGAGLRQRSQGTASQILGSPCPDSPGEAERGSDLPGGDRLPAGEGEGPAPCTRGPDSWAYIVLQDQRVAYKTSTKTLLSLVEGEK